mgnify:FL=1
MMFLDRKDPIVDIKELLYARLAEVDGEERSFILYLLDIIERS